MAKGSSTRGSAYGSPSSLTSLLSPSKQTQAIVTAAPAIFPSASSLRPYTLIEPWGVESDGRFHNPTRRSAKPSSLINAATRLHQTATHAVGFAQPDRTAICVRRRVRKEVLFARNRTGSGGRSKHRRRNFWSKVKC